MMKRLEKGSGDDLEFWEIKVQRKKREVRIRSGLATTMGRTVVEEHASYELAVAAMQRAIAEKLAEGWIEPVDVRVAADAKKGVSLANPEIEALIAANPSAIEPYLVYADWLMQRHDPRGELINVQVKLAEHPSSIAFQRMQEDLFRRFKKELLGDMIAAIRASNPKSSFRWRYGFLRAARCVSFRPDRAVESQVRGVLAHPSAKFLEHLAINFGWSGTGTSAQETFGAIEQLAPSTLRSISVGDRHAYRLDLGALWKTLRARPTITTLTLASRMDVIQSPDGHVPHVSTLRLLQFDHPALDSLFSVEWSNVTTLDILMSHPPRIRGYTTAGQPAPLPPTTRFSTLLPRAFPHVKKISFKIDSIYPERLNDEGKSIEFDLRSAATQLGASLDLTPAPFPDLLDF